jgi:ATP-binding cassette subfamily B protein
MSRPGTIGRYVVRYRRWYAAGALALLLVNACDVALPLVLKLAIDDIVLLRGAIPIWSVAAGYMGFVLLLAVFRYFWRVWFIGASHRVANDLRRRLFEHLLLLSPSYFDRVRTGDLMSRATADLESVRQFYSQGLLLTLDTFCYLAVMPPIMLLISSELTLYSLAPLPLIPLLVYWVGGAIHERSARAQALTGETSAAVEETVAGIRVVQGFAQEERQAARLHALGARTRDASMDVARLQGALQPAVSLVMAAGVVVVILLGGEAAIEGRISVGDFVAFQHYLLKIAWPMQAIGLIVGLYQRAFASMERIDEVLAERPAIVDAPDADPAARVSDGRISFRGVTLRYSGAVEDALSAIDLEVAPGRTVALVGPVGCGKSSLLALLVRERDPSAGAVLLDGVDARRIPLAALRGAIAAVPQETFLFADTVEENIALGAAADLPPEARRAAVREAAARAQVLADIEAIPGGFDALLGERGVTLSGGQRQRVAIARAVLRAPRVLLLDDCLSAVDAETEERILRGLREVMRGRACLFASHRLSAARAADEIVVLDRGRIVERGTHDALAAAGGLYARMWARQRLEAEVEGDEAAATARGAA